MIFKFSNIGIISYSYGGGEKFYYLPLFDAVPKNIYSVCSFQRFRIDDVSDNEVTLYCRDKQGNLITDKINITSACKQNSSVMFCLCKTEHNALLLYVYCDYAHNGLFALNEEFIAKAAR